MTFSDAPAGLDRLIPAEITHDRFYRAIADIAALEGVRHILEIGSSSGAGSTEAFVAGALRNKQRPDLHCLEVSTVRFAALAERYRSVPFVHCHNVSSVSLERFPAEDDVASFHREIRSKLRKYPLNEVLGWLRADKAYVAEHGLSRDGIRQILRENQLEIFDAVLIDGSEFTGRAELDDVYGARFLLLDDTRSYKNWHNVRRLSSDARYRLVKRSRWLRNGFAVFERVNG
jgi:hypothetical protein